MSWVTTDRKSQRNALLSKYATKQELLKATSTRQLLGWRVLCYKFGTWNPIDKNHTEYLLTINDIKNELATREHIPNKIESRLLRKQRIQQGE